MDVDQLREALEEADLPVLLMALVHITGERRWIEPPFQPVRDMRIIAEPDGGLPADVQRQIREAALEVLSGIDPGESFPALADDLVHEMMNVCVAEDVAPEYVPLLLHEMGLRERPQPPPAGNSSFEVLVIGA